MDYTCKEKFLKDYNRLLWPKCLSYNLRYLTPESFSGVSLCSRLMISFFLFFFHLNLEAYSFHEVITQKGELFTEISTLFLQHYFILY